MMPAELVKKTLDQWSELHEELVQDGACLQDCGSELSKAVGMGFFLFNRFVDGGLIPTLRAMTAINRDISDSFIATLRGDKRLPAHLHQMREKLRSAVRYEQLIGRLGGALFGSARFAGERPLAENDFFRLSYIPADPSVTRQAAALFHCGGFLPYSDRIFRFLPESNLFAPFVARGVPVYAVELKGDKRQLSNIGSCTLERYIDVLSDMSAIAFAHNGRQPLVLEGYCGLAMQAIAYLAAKPEEADARFNAAFTMVAPVDGSKCEILNDMISTIPRRMIIAHNVMSELFGGYISGDNIRAGMDIPLNSFFQKTSFGRFVRGWQSGEFGEVRRIDDLSPQQRKELAGAYWISPESAKRYPMPVDMASFASRLWLEAIADGHRIPYSYKGRPLSLQAIRDRTGLLMAGFYGGKDAIVPDGTAQPMIGTLGERYTHVVHPKAGHISYVLSPEVWNREHKYALDPNPIDLMLEMYNRRQAQRGAN